MLEPLLQALGSRRIILASSSPRRQELLKTMGLKFEVIPSEYDESTLDPQQFENPSQFVLATAKNKVEHLENQLKSRGETYDVIIGADTMISHKNRVFGKPASETEATKILQGLNGQTHQVLTGVCVRTPMESQSFCETTNVTFGDLPPQVIEAYVASGEPMGKAGAYGIQGKGGSFVSRIEGDYFNVVGLPLHKLCSTLWAIFK